VTDLDATATAHAILEAEERLARMVCGDAEAAPVEVLREMIARERADGCTEIAMKYSVTDPLLRVLFVALCRRYGLTAFRRAGQRKTTFSVEGPPRFLQEVWPPLFDDCARAVVSRAKAWIQAVAAQLDDRRDVAEDG